MKDILSEIIANKRFEVDLQKQAISIEQLQEGIHEIPASGSMKKAVVSHLKGGSSRRHVPKKLFHPMSLQVLLPSLFSLMKNSLEEA